MKALLRFTVRLFSVGFLLAIIAVAGVIGAIWYYGRDLPDYRALADYEPAMVSRVYAGNGLLVGEFADERRIFVPIEAIPVKLRQAFLAAEDRTFYEHPGIDLPGILNAIYINLRNIGGNRRPIGASTITQQVAKNFLLTSETTMTRKIKEMILAFRIERTFSKNQIFELYLNEISLGNRSFGVAAAALSYYGKSLKELTVAEMALLAAMPKAPSALNPRRHPKRATARRNWVLGQMENNGFITAEETAKAKAEPITLRRWNPSGDVPAGFFVEEIRREMLKRYGDEKLRKGGYVVRSSLNPHYQKIAYRVLRKGLVAYDRRHGWRGAFTNLGEVTDWAKKLTEYEAIKDYKKRPHPAALGGWRLAIVIEIHDKDTVKTVGKKRVVTRRHAVVGFSDGTKGSIPFQEMTWARERKPEQRLGPSLKKVSDVLKLGDVIAVEPVEQPTNGKKRKKPYPEGTYTLRQVPNVQGAIVVLDPHTGRVLAMVGGYAFGVSQYNRAIQAKRQPGSAFKPFVYLTALDNGYTPSSVILDAPAVIGNYKPQNYDNKYLGLMTLRRGLEKSRNAMTVRLAQAVGMEPIAQTAETFGVGKDLPREFSMTLGAVETTVLDLTTAYAMLANGGKRIRPTFIDRIQDRYGKTISKHDRRPCPDCRAADYSGGDMPVIKDIREQIADERSVFQIVSMLQGVVERGTGGYVRAVGKPIAGKTGTTNDFLDAWFVGFTPDLAMGVWVGFDTPVTLGYGESGGRAASTIFRDFMIEALKDKPATSFRVPRGLTMVRVNAKTGQPAQAGDKAVILEAFKPGSQPGGNDGARSTARGLRPKTAPEAGTGGHY
ncbi:MAG: penicillin-binding protein 1A [Alphaproteobacteria bacterium]